MRSDRLFYDQGDEVSVAVVSNGSGQKMASWYVNGTYKTSQKVPNGYDHFAVGGSPEALLRIVDWTGPQKRTGVDEATHFDQNKKHVVTTANLADIFTKLLPGPHHHRLRSTLMGNAPDELAQCVDHR